MSLLLAQQSAGGGLSVSAALVEGADALAAQVSVTVAASAAVTEGADTLAAQVGPQVAVSLAQTEGADVLAAAVGISAGSLDFSAALLEGDDVLLALVGTAQGGGYDDEKKTKRRYVVERGGKLHVYATQAAALRALEANDKDERDDTAQEVVPLPTVQAYAEVAGRIDDYNAAWNSRAFEQLMALFDQMRAQLDEEDVEMLLLAA